MSLADFVDIINKVNEDNSSKEKELDRMKHCCLKMKHCCLKIKHCCVKPPPGTKYTTKEVSWCSNK
jgi:hypothetical protein